MSADGSRDFRLADGIYLDLPLSDYLADPALSGSAFKLLLTDPAGWRWQRPDNPLAERVESRPMTRGSAAHCAILEGLDAYEARYALAPERSDYPDALETNDELKAWLRDAGAKLTGAKADLIERIKTHCRDAGVEPPPIWPEIEAAAVGARTVLRPADDVYVRMLERFLRADRDLGPLVENGYAEVSIIWTDGDVRYKARLDYVTAGSITELKTFGQPPRRGRSLRQHVVGEIATHGYDLQAVHNALTWRVAGERFRADALPIVSTPATADAAVDLGLLLSERSDPGFCWLFIRMGGAPSAIALPFRPGSARWIHAEADRARAIETWRAFSAAFGDALWMQSEGVAEIEDGDFPLWAWDVAH